MNEKTLIKVPAYNDVTAESKVIFDQLISASGKVSDIYATIGYSANALGSYMAFVRAQSKGSFHAKEREAIYLIVSQLNNCEYCLAAHTLSAIKFGWTEEETIALRANNYPEAKWQVIYKLIASVIEHKGDVNDDVLNSFFGLGYKEAALMDLMALINVMIFTNYIYRMTKIPIDFPLAKKV